MKIKQLVFITLLLAKQAIWGCYIVDPTYDFAFKVLFGGVEEGSKERLISFLNSILNEKPFNIVIHNIEYKNLETQNSIGNVLRFDVRCSCTKQVNGKKVDFELDVEMQKSKLDDYFQRITRYSARLLDIYKGREQNTPQVNVIVISILDCILNQCEEDIVFRICSGYKETLQGRQIEQNGKIVLVDETITHIGIQLPLYAEKIIQKDQGIRYGNNPWLHLLGSRRITKGIKCNSVPEGKYDFKDEVVTNSGAQEIKSAIEELNRIANNTQPEYQEAIVRANNEIDENAKVKEELAQRDKDLVQTREDLAQTREDLAQTREDLAQTREELAQRDEDLARMRQVKEFKKQVKKFKKDGKKPKKSELPEKFKELDNKKIKEYVEQYVQEENDDSISELDDFLNQMQEN